MGEDDRSHKSKTCSESVQLKSCHNTSRQPILKPRDPKNPEATIQDIQAESEGTHSPIINQRQHPARSHASELKSRDSVSSKPSSPFSSISPTPPPTTPSTGSPDTMTKLSQTLKNLINASHARPQYTTPNNTTLQPLISRLADSAASHNIGTPAWLTFSTATAMTMNAPSALTTLWHTAQQHDRSLSPVTAAELQREVGLKCISFNGIPRTINCLGAFYNSLPTDVRTKLSKTPTREYDSGNIEARKTDGLGLWDSVYFGFERKLLEKLGQSHPDLPVHIINGHYASLLSNPSRRTYTEGGERPREVQVGRVLTSLVAIACLRAQTGVGPQVVSHVFGLRKAYERGDAEAEGEVEVQGGKWLSGEEGNKWLLEWIDELVAGIGTAQEGDTREIKSGSTFAPGMTAREKAKL